MHFHLPKSIVSSALHVQQVQKRASDCHLVTKTKPRKQQYGVNQTNKLDNSLFQWPLVLPYILQEAFIRKS